MAGWKRFLLNGFLSMMDMKQHIMMGTEMANCCDDHYYKSSRSLDTFEKFPVSSGDQSVQFYTNPVIKQNAPDPSVVRLADGSGWVAIVTSDHSSRYAHDPRAFPLYYSRDLINWELRSWVFGRRNWPGWARDNMWAPELHHVNGRYMVYFAARDMAGQTVCGAAMAQSADPFGPYLDIGRPLVSATESVGGAIDPHYFKDPQSGRDYLLWKEDKPLSLQASVILVRELHPSGIYFVGPPVEILKSTLDHVLEERLVAEAPWMMFHGGYYYLFYSSAWTTEMKYHIRVAVGKSVYGPFHRSHTPVITTDWETMHQGHNCSFVGPGHGSVVDVDGEWWLFYHAWINGKMNSAPGRLMLMDKIQWRNGWPLVGVPSDTPKPAPSIRNNIIKNSKPRIKSVNSLPHVATNEIINTKTVSKKDFKSSLPSIKSSIKSFVTSSSSSDQTHFVPSTPLSVSRLISTSSSSSGKKPKFRTYTIKQPNNYYLLP